MDDSNANKYTLRFREADEKYQSMVVSTYNRGTLLKSNSTYFALPFQRGTVGSNLAIIDQLFTGNSFNDNKVPLLSGHKNTINDFNFHPFHDNIIATASEDNTTKLWKIPQLGFFDDISTPAVDFALKRSVLGVEFNPVVDNVLASLTKDKVLHVSDLEHGTVFSRVQVDTDVTSCAWEQNGGLVAVFGKSLNIIDPRAQKVALTGPGHGGPRAGFKVQWLEGANRLLTTGVNSQINREVCLWDLRHGDSIQKLHAEEIDSSSSVLIPFMDTSSGLLYLFGKGDRIVHCYKMEDDYPYFHRLAHYQTTQAMQYVAFMPKNVLDYSHNEVARFLKLGHNNTVEPVRCFVAPTDEEEAARDLFQAEFFPYFPATKPSLNTASWMKGEQSPLVKKPVTVGLYGIGDFADKEFADLTLEFEDTSQIKVHKFVLWARSSKFAQLLQVVTGDRLPMPGVQRAICEAFLNYLYTDNLTANHEDLSSLAQFVQEFELNDWRKEELLRRIEGLKRYKVLPYKSSFVEDLKKTYNSVEAFPDFEIRLVNDHRVLKVHKRILYSRATYFETVLTSGMAEAQKSVMTFGDLSFEVAELLMHYLYYNDADFTPNIVLDVWNAALCYNIKSLQNACEAILKLAIDEDNCVSLLSIAHQYNSRLTYLLINYIVDNYPYLHSTKPDILNELSDELKTRILSKLPTSMDQSIRDKYINK